MADVDDLWFKTVRDADGTTRREKTARHGTGKRYRARWRAAGGGQRSRSFSLRRDAEAFLAQITSDLARGSYVDPSAGRVRFEDFARRWLAGQTSDPSTREAVERRLRLHVFPTLGPYELGKIRPSDIQMWARGLQSALGPATVRVIFANVSSVLSAAVDDQLIGANPCAAGSVRPPNPGRQRVFPWPAARIEAVRQELPLRYREIWAPAAGGGLRQGEVFGLTQEDVDVDRGEIHVRRQVKIVRSRLVFAPPKRGKERMVPLAGEVADALGAQLAEFAPVPVTLPWLEPGGPSRTFPLIFTSRERGALNRNYFNTYVWKPALKAAGVPETRDNGMHALRHYFASVVLAGGASIRDLAEWLGHEDPGFTLRVYAHLLPNSADKLRDAIAGALTPGCGTDVSRHGLGRASVLVRPAFGQMS